MLMRVPFWSVLFAAASSWCFSWLKFLAKRLSNSRGAAALKVLENLELPLVQLQLLLIHMST